MIIKEIGLNNFRIYKGQNLLDLTSDVEDKNIFIVSGKNGFGKTTLLMSFVWCLYGRQMSDVDELYDKEISEKGGYPKYISESLNTEAANEGINKFSVSVTFGDVVVPEIDCKEVKITRTYIVDGSNEDQLEILVDGHPNELADEMGLEIFIREFILPKEIAKFFFFDAEKIVNLAESTSVEHNRMLSLAYSEVLGIKKYEDLKANLESIRLELRKKSASAADEDRLNILEAEIENIERKQKDIEDEQRDIHDEISAKRLTLNQIQQSLIQAGESITVEQLNEMRAEDTVLTAKHEELEKELRGLQEMIPFAIAGLRLSEVTDQLASEQDYRNSIFKNEELQEASNKILTALLEEEKKFPHVIPANVHEFYHAKIKKLIADYLVEGGADIPEDFKVHHDFSDGETSRFIAVVNHLKTSFKEQLKRINSEYTQARNERDAIRRRIRDAESKAEEPRLQKLRLDKGKYEDEIRALENKKDDNIASLTQYRIEHQQKVKEREALSEKIEVSAANKRKDAEIKDMIEDISKFLVSFKEEKKKGLQRRILDSLQSLMHKKGFVNQVEVTIIEQEIDIQLLDKKGKQIRKEALSKGEQQLYATSLLKGLVEESDFEFPVFIDSPMQKFDEDHAEKIIMHFYPKVSDQVVIFPLINKEMTLKEFNLIKPKTARTYLIKQDSSTNSGFMEVMPDNLFIEYEKMNHVS
jgi:DNA sulfur modification protein DndD